MALVPEVGKDAAEDLTSDGAVTKTILVEGEGDKAGRGAKVTVKYSMRLSNDRSTEPFDTSEQRSAGVLQFTLGKRKVIPALELITQSMKLGEKCEAQATAPYAFGVKGLRRKGVPSNARVFMEVEMLSYEGGEKLKTMTQMNPAERFEEAKKCKELGNDFFKELNASLSGAVATPVAKTSPDLKESPSIQEAEKENAGQSLEGKGNEDPDEARQDGFSEAEIIDGSKGNMTPTDVPDEEEVETIDVSTTSQQEISSGDVADVVTNTSVAEGESAASAVVPNGGIAPKPEDPASVGPENEDAEENQEDEDPEEKEVVALHVTTLNNLSLCFVKLEDFKRAAESASLALRMDPENYKALYYRGRAQVAIGDWEKARSDLVAAAKIQPNNIGIRMEIQKLDKKKKQFEEKEKKQAAAMFA